MMLVGVKAMMDSDWRVIRTLVFCFFLEILCMLAILKHIPQQMQRLGRYLPALLQQQIDKTCGEALESFSQLP